MPFIASSVCITFVLSVLAVVGSVSSLDCGVGFVAAAIRSASALGRLGLMCGCVRIKWSSRDFTAISRRRLRIIMSVFSRIASINSPSSPLGSNFFINSFDSPSFSTVFDMLLYSNSSSSRVMSSTFGGGGIVPPLPPETRFEFDEGDGVKYIPGASFISVGRVLCEVVLPPVSSLLALAGFILHMIC